MLCTLVILIYINSNTHIGKYSGFDFFCPNENDTSFILLHSVCVRPNRPQRIKCILA